MSAEKGSRVFVVGVGMTPFLRGGQSKPTYVDVGRTALLEALEDAALSVGQVDAVVASYNNGDPSAGHRVSLAAGVDHVPIINVNGNCSAGSVALAVARKLVLSGEHRCVVAVGFEQMTRTLDLRWTDRVSPYELHFDMMDRLGVESKPLSPGMNAFTDRVIKMFAYAARQYMTEYPETPSNIYSVIAHKNRVQGASNPRAMLSSFPVPAKPEETATVCEPIKSAMVGPTATGAAAAVVVSEDWLRDAAVSARTRARAVEIAAQAVVTDRRSDLQGSSFLDLVGVCQAKDAASQCFAVSGLTPSEVDVVELHDCFSPNELFILEALGFARAGEGAKLFQEGRWVEREGGARQLAMCGERGLVVNPSGGLETKGHPIGATGLGQCFELVTQLRGEGGTRQVPGAGVGLQHNFGMGSTCVVTLYRRAAGPAPATPKAKL